MVTEASNPAPKRPGLKPAALGVLLAFFCAAAQAQTTPADAPVIRWLVQDVPPYMSFPLGRAPQRPADLGNGEIDGFMRLLIAQLPQYRHEFLDANYPRFEALVHQGQALCSSLHVRTPDRLTWLYYTPVYPPLFSRQVHLIVHRDTLAKLGLPNAAQASANPIKLAEVLQRADLQGLLPRDRSFGPKIDALLQAQGERAPQTMVVGRGMHVLPMLRAKRMDYTLEYAATVLEFERSLGRPYELVALPLAEGHSTDIATVACTRNAEGRKLIEAIDAAARRLAQDPDRAAWIRSWRGDQLDEADRQRLKRFLDERAKGGVQIE